MSVERIGMERALPMFVLGASCMLISAIVFSILCGFMLRSRRRIEKLQHEKEKPYPFSLANTQSQNSIQFPTYIPNNKINNTNQSAAIHINDHQISIELDPTFKIHPHYPFSMKRIIEL